ncbi:Methylglyoxal synthase [Spirochaeta thermophila DSM 6578]|uniref:Methylglyoxal synthase n=1 Tax=Winmispira thermophila (strain ATCC 700085 / DSM 6578 / Z-1203) TaxID=869211 RepID=G0GD80_WINT7|nr:methylglyoxal synthase [Spirochaeta thermophila]AEJ62155.1 Methylglyoxal synthase [Spirochaeta thermophila DSM 6578]
MDFVKTIGLVAHDNRKQDLIEWVRWNYKTLIQHRLVCTGTTGRLVQQTIEELMEPGDRQAHPIVQLKSGPLGGDQQMGAMIAEGKIDILIFLWDPMEPQPHDVDVKALLRIAVLYNIPVANNRSTADFIISSPLFYQQYEPVRKDYSVYLRRSIPGVDARGGIS